MSPVYTIRKADTIAVFPEALFWQSQQEEAYEEPPGSSPLHYAIALKVCHRKNLNVSVFGISHSICIDGKHSFSFRKTGRVVDFADSGFPSSFPQIQSDQKNQQSYSLKIFVLFIVALNFFQTYILSRTLGNLSVFLRGISNLEESTPTLLPTLVDFSY